jgi:hypothetical protein
MRTTEFDEHTERDSKRKHEQKNKLWAGESEFGPKETHSLLYVVARDADSPYQFQRLRKTEIAEQKFLHHRQKRM